ncbi:hypothetical protein C0995_003736 [Termitomyces sp. Mi166|nr:hypothetical protein C0995_003736 [Termitomyces sp. Mi166\
MSVHITAQAGFGQGNELYDSLQYAFRARPSYQDFSLAYIRDIAKKSTGALKIVEIGAGTGIFTRALLAHPQWASDVKQIKAIEPSAGMRDVFETTVIDKRVTVQDGTFDNTNVEDRWADLVIIAQAFHWCPDYDKASAEFARILKPGGSLVFIWNLEDRDRARWVAQLRDRIEKHEQGTPQFRLNLWRQAFETASYREFFEPPVEKVWPYVLLTTVDTVVDRASSKSYIGVLPPTEKAEVQVDVRRIVDKGEDKVWIDEEKVFLPTGGYGWSKLHQQENMPASVLRGEYTFIQR